MLAHALCQCNRNSFAAADIITANFGRRELTHAKIKSSPEFFLNVMVVFSPECLIAYPKFGDRTLSSLLS